MFDTRLLQQMYQQWCQGQSPQGYMHRWVDFVESSARELKANPADVMRELQKCSWFNWNSDLQ